MQEYMESPKVEYANGLQGAKDFTELYSRDIFGHTQPNILERISEEMDAARVAEATASSVSLKAYFRGYLDGLAREYVAAQDLS